MRAFIDTDVLIDVLAQREPHYQASAAVWTLATEGAIQACVSAISFNNIHYIVRRLATTAKAKKALALLRDSFEIIPLDARIIHQAMDSAFKDFEDAIQYFSAVRAQAACLVTRNVRHYSKSDIAVSTPKEFLAGHFDAE